MRSAITLALVALAACVIFAWGLSWDFGGRYDCASGSYFLADLGWALDGLLLAAGLGLFVGALLAGVLGGLRSLLLTIAVSALLGVVGQAGGSMGATAAGCPGDADGIAGPLLVVALLFGGLANLITLGIRAWMGRRPRPQTGRGS